MFSCVSVIFHIDIFVLRRVVLATRVRCVDVYLYYFLP